MHKIIEGLILLAGEDGITLDDLVQTIQLDHTEVRGLIATLKAKIESEQRGMQLVNLADRYLFTTLPEHHDYVVRFANTVMPATLSRSALETLAIIAYKQPITKLEIDHLRGVKSERILNRLEKKGFINVQDSSAGIVYRTSKSFLDHFNLSSIADLQSTVC